MLKTLSFLVSRIKVLNIDTLNDLVLLLVFIYEYITLQLYTPILVLSILSKPFKVILEFLSTSLK